MIANVFAATEETGRHTSIVSSHMLIIATFGCIPDAPIRLN